MPRIYLHLTNAHNGDVIGYESTVIPRIGEMVSIKGEPPVRVVDVEHLLKAVPGFDKTEGCMLEMVTLRVQKI